MYDINDILLMIKQAAKDSFNAMDPSDVLYGTVESISPLRVRVDAKLLLEKVQLSLTRNVIDYDLEITVNHTTEVADGHTHGYVGRKVFRVNNALVEGEKVILIKVMGGQKYVILDKVVDA